MLQSVLRYSKEEDPGEVRGGRPEKERRNVDGIRETDLENWQKTTQEPKGVRPAGGAHESRCGVKCSWWAPPAQPLEGRGPPRETLWAECRGAGVEGEA